MVHLSLLSQILITLKPQAHSKQLGITWPFLYDQGAVLIACSNAVSIAFESDNGEKDLDGQLLDILKRSTTTATKGESGKAQLHKLDLQEKDVAKVFLTTHDALLQISSKG